MSSFFSNPENIANFNKVISQTSESLLCGVGSDCAKAKTADDLEKKYIASQVNLRTAPVQLDESEKNYYIYTQGEAAYNQFLTDKLTNSASSEVVQRQTQFDENIKKATQMNDTLHSLTINYINENELYEDYVKKNGLVKRKIDTKGSDIVTNDRKTYYENDNYDYLTGWYKVWWYIYIFLLVAFSIAMFITKSEYSLKIKALILLLFLAYPYIIDKIVFFIMGLIVKFISFIPKNVYLDIDSGSGSE